jgi:endogenous inhibitor of DNA gyrase (YacG/DUF329 family)
MAVKCPICGIDAEKPHSPFCSLRCAQADLGRWFSGQYGVAAEIDPDGGDAEALEKAIHDAMEDGTLIKGPFPRGGA